MDAAAGQKRPRPWVDGEDVDGTAPSSSSSSGAATSGTLNEAPSILTWFSEEDVGIKVYLSDGVGFGGVIKQRFTDFIVHELEKETGAPVRLTTLDVPVEDGPQREVGGDGNVLPLMVTGFKKLEQLIGAEVTARFRDMLAAAGVDVPAWGPSSSASTERESGATPKPACSEVVLPAPADKDARKSVHLVVRSYFPMCDSDTLTSHPGGKGSQPPAATPATSQLRLLLRSGAAGPSGAASAGGSGGNNKGENKFRVSRRWPAARPNFLRFVMHKRNFDTPGAIHALVRCTGLSDNLFGYAGIKDRRGVTSQHVTAFQVAPERLATAVNASFGGDLLVGGFSYVKTKLRLGDLGGNRFSLVIRNVARAPAEAALAVWAETGHVFVNYFGLQRFGTGEVPTHDVGRAMLQRRWDAALAMLLLPRAAGEKEEVTAARRVFASTRDAGAAYDAMPRYLHVERALLKGMVDVGGAAAPGASLAAFDALPHRTRSLYLHAYQSVLWNRMATARLQAGAAGPMAGDLVYVDAGDGGAGDDGGGQEGEDDKPTAEAGASSSGSGGGGGGGGGGGTLRAKGQAYGVLPDVRVLTVAEAASGTFSITDVLLPLPGYAVTYPGPGHVCSAAAYARLLEEDGVRLAWPTFAPSAAGGSAASDEPDPPAAGLVSSSVSSSAASSHPAAVGTGPEDEAAAVAAMRPVWHPRLRDYQLSGGYRRVVERARDVQWGLVTYTHPNQQVAATDRDQLPPGQWPVVVGQTPVASSSSSPLSSLSSCSEAVSAVDSSAEDACAGTLGPSEGILLAPRVSSDTTGLTTAPAASSSPSSFTGLKLAFSLGKSAYATMVLRELMKVSTAKADQAALNALAAGSLPAATASAAAPVVPNCGVQGGSDRPQGEFPRAS